ncbi:MAG: hypothetical protein CML22_06770 [Rheinheimera sp.]|nr:hypothetical protein [Rheinheimera sp.]MBM33985.1 hypothetical protein [Rheinheimera sp.]|tara:strand:- start:5995 stop:6219 length:225 start_codon:yes stop_codon:yes gene_type:complete
MDKLSEEAIRAKLLVLRHASPWMLDQVTGYLGSEILLDENYEMPPALARDAHKFCNETDAKIAALEYKLKELSQ